VLPDLVAAAEEREAALTALPSLGFHRDIIATWRGHQIPVMHRGEWVEKHGAKVALKPDMVHFSDEFMPVMVETIRELATRVAVSR
jgi:hypothetical protein